MREDVADVDNLPPVFDHEDEPVLVSADIEYREKPHGSGVRKAGADLNRVSPDRVPGHAVPAKKRLQWVPVRSGGFGNRRVADAPHRS